VSIEAPTRAELLRGFIQRFLAYQDTVTDFSRSSVASAFARAVAASAEIATQTAMQVLRRTSLLSAEGDSLSEALVEVGTSRKAAARASVLVCFRPAAALVDSISAGTGPHGGDEITVVDATDFAVGMSIRIRSADGTVTETSTIQDVTGEVIEVGTLVGSYSPGSEDVKIIARITIPAGTALATTSGVGLSTVESVTTGEANAILDGASTAVGLADIAWAEADEPGEAGNIDPYDITDLLSPVDGLLSAFNPAPATAGAAEESDADARRRAIYLAATASQTTAAWLEAVAREGNVDVLRALKSDVVGGLNEIGVRVLTRSGGALGTTEKEDLAAFIAQRSRAGLDVTVYDVTLTSVEITATVTLAAGAVLREVWVAAAGRVADYLDLRSWTGGEDVDASELYNLVKGTTGIAGIDPGDFTPAADLVVDEESLPVLAYLQLTDAESGETVGGDLAVAY